MKKISVIITNYNYDNYVSRAIDSVFKQTYANFETIIVDDGSIDHSKSLLSKYQRRYPQKIHTVFKPNGGQGSALNAGFAISSGDIICFLDSDDYWYPNKLSKVEKEHRTYSFVQHNLSVEGNQKFRAFRSQEHVKKDILKTGMINHFVPISGISISRNLANYIFPVPETHLDVGANLYISLLAVFSGEMFCIDDALGKYNLHDNSYWRDRLENEMSVSKIVSLANEQLLKIGKSKIEREQRMFVIKSFLGDSSYAQTILKVYSEGILIQRPRYMLYKALALLLLGYEKEALADIKRHRKDFVDFTGFMGDLMIIGDILYQNGHLEMALKVYSLVHDKRAGLRQVELLTKIGRSAEAIDVFDKVTSRKQNRSDSYHEGLCLRLLGRYDEALEKFQAVLAKQGESSQVYTQIGHVHLSLHQFKDALSAFRHALKKDPSKIDIKYMIVNVLAKLERFQEGTDALLEIKKKHAEEVVSNSYKYACHLSILQHYEEAIKMFDKIDEKDPGFVNARYQRAGAIAQIGRRCEEKGNIDEAFDKYNEAIKYFQEVVATSPERVDVRLSISDVYKYLKKYDEAMRGIDEVEKLAPHLEILGPKRKQIIELWSQYSGHVKMQPFNEHEGE